MCSGRVLFRQIFDQRGGKVEKNIMHEIYDYNQKTAGTTCLSLYCSTGGHSKKDQMSLEKKGQYIGFCVYRRPYLLGPPVIAAVYGNHKSLPGVHFPFFADNIWSYLLRSPVLVNPCSGAVSFWGQTTWNLTGFSPQRDWRSKRVKSLSSVLLDPRIPLRRLFAFYTHHSRQTYIPGSK